MPERYPPDAQLLELVADETSGIEYIPTGQTPYYLQFRRLIDRLNRVALRANELRPYQVGDLVLGVRPGRAVINGEVLVFEGEEDIEVSDDATTNVYLDDAGGVAITTDPFPADRSTHIRIATVTAADGEITDLVDLRGEHSNFAPFAVEAQALRHAHHGSLTVTQNNRIAGIAPTDGTILDVILTLGTNMESNSGSDGITAAAKVNGVALCETDPQITSAAGSGRRSTAQADGTAAVVKSDGTEQVEAGDLITVDLLRTETGIISVEAADVVVAVLFRPNRPE